ncbi:hypothetical protein [uncultured Bacteroides sp.]|uniref:hypothetical protein n=1 Tax=uncultured Bacteroides sp. TaxID=162156 RepID=UPI002AAABE11|nr:hypothetical protein [uncultured Bacteroides sp.]
MKKLLLLLFTTLLVSCGSSQFIRKTMLIENGMSKNEVLNLLGTPKDRQFHTTEEIWEYEVTTLTETKYYFVWFKNDKVSGLTSETEYANNNNRPMPIERRR